MLALEAEILRLIKKFYGEWSSSVTSEALSSTSYNTAGSHTWTVPTGVTYAYVTICGGGGGGGGSVNSASQGRSAGGGGGSSQTIWRRLVTGLIPAGSVTVVIGAAGTGGDGVSGVDYATADNGVAGGDSTFGTSGDLYYLSALGGYGGYGGVYASMSYYHGGSGGSGGGGSHGGQSVSAEANYSSNSMQPTVGAPCVYSEDWIGGASGGAGIAIGGFSYWVPPSGFGGSSAKYFGGVSVGQGGGGGASMFGAGGSGGASESDGGAPSSTAYGAGGGGAGVAAAALKNGGDGICGYCLIEYPTI